MLFGYGPMITPDTVVKAKGQMARSPLDEAYDTIEELRRKDVTNLPTRPEPMVNPYANPAVMLGLAMQGQGAEAISAGARIQAMNKQRLDEYNAQVLQAQNYRQERQEKFAMTLADLKVRASQAEQEAVDKTLNRFENAQERAATQERFETEQDRLKANAMMEQRRWEAEQAFRQREYEERTAEQQTVNRQNLAFKDDPQFALFRQRLEALQTGEILVPDSTSPNGFVVKSLDVDDTTMSPKQKLDAINQLRAQIAFGLQTYYGVAPKYVASELDTYNTLFDSWASIYQQRVSKGGAFAVGPGRPQGPPTEGGALSAADTDMPTEPTERLAATLELKKFKDVDVGTARDYDPTSAKDVRAFLEEFSAEMEAGELQQFAEFEMQKANQPFFKRALGNEGLNNGFVVSQRELILRRFVNKSASDPAYISTKPGKQDFVTLAREIAQEEARTLVDKYEERLSDVTKKSYGTTLNKKRMQALQDKIRMRLMAETGVRRGYVSTENRPLNRAITEGLTELSLRGYFYLPGEEE